MPWHRRRQHVPWALLAVWAIAILITLVAAVYFALPAHALTPGQRVILLFGKRKAPTPPASGYLLIASNSVLVTQTSAKILLQ